jgi:hypothetical protein
MIVPALAIGIFIIFGVGYGISYNIFSKVIKRDENEPAGSGEKLDEKAVERLSLVGGVFAVLLLIIIILNIPKQWQLLSLVLLNVIGVIGGLLTFLIKR